MKHIGKILKEHIESNKLVKGEVAKKAGISYNYLSTIFKQPSVDADLLERLCVASGLHPSVVFDIPEEIETMYKDIWAKTLLGSAKVEINSSENLRALLNEKERIIEEKERTIQILMSRAGIPESGQNRDNYDK
ncbi:MAG: helix-turn-helix domain-containing protein [Muribaculaceae bacterium]|nr:helix-turn-helix domain-containing protein [Muribaculaceae bacterium]